MMRSKRILFGLLLLVFAIATGWWIFHFPFRPELVLRVLPSEATVITRHLAPADRWMAFVNAPVVSNVVRELSVDGAAITEALRSEDTAWLVNTLGGRYVVSGILPSTGARREPALVFSSWIGGGYTQLMRWGFLDRYLEGVNVVDLGKGLRVWQLPCPEIRPGYVLSFTVHEGALVGCLSRDSLGLLLRYILPRVQQQFPVTALAQPWAGKRKDVVVLDELRAEGSLPNDGGAFLLLGALHEVGRSGLVAEVNVHLDRSPITVGEWVFPSRCAILVDAGGLPASLLGDAPSILMAMPVGQISPALGVSADQRVSRFWVSQQAGFKADGVAHLFAGGDEYCGRIMGMKIPSVGIAIPLRAGAGGTAVIQNLVDGLNRDFSLGLISTADPQDERIRVLESVRSGSVKLLKGDGRPALAVCEGWLIGASSVGVLRQILRTTPEAPPQWASDLAKHESLACGWSDLSSASELALNALAGYTLVSLMRARAGEPSKRYDTDLLKAVLRSVGVMGEAAVWVESGESSLALHATLRFPDAAPQP